MCESVLSADCKKPRDVVKSNSKIREGATYKGGEAMEQVVQIRCGCPIPDRIQRQAGWGIE